MKEANSMMGRVAVHWFLLSLLSLLSLKTNLNTETNSSNSVDKTSTDEQGIKTASARSKLLQHIHKLQATLGGETDTTHNRPARTTQQHCTGSEEQQAGADNRDACSCSCSSAKVVPYVSIYKILIAMAVLTKNN